MRAACYGMADGDGQEAMARALATRAREIVGKTGRVKILLSGIEDTLTAWKDRGGVARLMRGHVEERVLIIADLLMLGKNDREVAKNLIELRASKVRVVSLQGNIDSGTEKGASWIDGFIEGTGLDGMVLRRRIMEKQARLRLASKSKAAVERASYPMGYGFKRVKFRTYMRWLEMRLVGVLCIEMRKEGYLEWQIADATGLPFWIVPEYVAGELRLQAIEATGQPARPTSPDPPNWPKRDGPAIADSVWKSSMKETHIPLPSSYKEKGMRQEEKK